MADDKSKTKTVFADDLMACTRLLYQYTELVCSRNSTELGVIHDIRISNFSNASQKLQSALYGLKKHLHKDLHEAVESVHKLASYLHTSFLSVMQYKRPYGPANPFGITVDAGAKLTNGDFPVDRLVIAAFKMVTMGMLLVHHFVLEHMMWLSAVHHELDRELMTMDQMNAFVEMMRSLRVYMYLEFANRDNAYKLGQRVAAGGRRQDIDLLDMIDCVYTMDELRDAFEHSAPAMKSIVIRECYYTMIMASLDYYGADNPPAELLNMTDGGPCMTFKIAYNGLYPLQRRIDDLNLRDGIHDAFKCFTTEPVYYYATTAACEDAGDNDRLVVQNNGGNINIVPRRQVHVWRLRPVWNDDYYIAFALVHGEASMMSDVIFSMAALVTANRAYRLTNRIEAEHFHLMMTRMDGPVEIMYRFRNRLLQEFTRMTDQTNNRLRGIVDPVIPNAVVVQPMPETLKAWTRNYATTFDEGTNFTRLLTNGVFHRSKSINLNDTVKKTKKNPLTTNLKVTLELLYPELQCAMNMAYCINTMFYLHYGNAVCSLPYIRENRVFGGDLLTIADADYNTYHTRPIAAYLNGADQSAFVYDNTARVQDHLRKRMAEITKAVENAPPPFIHPTSWLTDEQRADANQHWEQCDQSFDLNKGTFVTFTPAVGEARDAEEVHNQQTHTAMEHMRRDRNMANFDPLHRHIPFHF